jgi:Family of unknown function (DUF5681)
MDQVTDRPARTGNGQFAPGCSGNPKGKAPGTRNRATLLRDVLRDGDETEIVQKLIDRARDGNSVSAPVRARAGLALHSACKSRITARQVKKPARRAVVQPRVTPLPNLPPQGGKESEWCKRHRLTPSPLEWEGWEGGRKLTPRPCAVAASAHPSP